MMAYSREVEQSMRNFYGSLSEKDRRRYAAVEAAKLSRGGKAYVAGLFGCDPDTVAVGEKDLACLPDDEAQGRVRKKGGRKKASLADADLVPRLRQNLETHTAGSPVEPGALWTNRSAAQLADELSEQGHSIDRKTVQRILRDELALGRRQISKKLAMDESADRDAQFKLVQKYKAEFLAQGFPVLSIDTKKKELYASYVESARLR